MDEQEIIRELEVATEKANEELLAELLSLELRAWKNCRGDEAHGIPYWIVKGEGDGR